MNDMTTRPSNDDALEGLMAAAAEDPPLRSASGTSEMERTKSSASNFSSDMQRSKSGASAYDDPSSSKVFFVDDRVAVVFSGLAADGRVLANRARLECQRHRLMAGAPASVSHVAAHVAGLMHECTRTGARRLFGVECLVVGFEPDARTAALERRRAWVPRLFHTDPSGSLNEWTAGAIGARAGEARELLESAADGLGEMGLDEIAALASRIVSDSSDDRTVPVITLIDAKTKR